MSLRSIAINPVPPGALSFNLVGYDETRLRAAIWQPTVTPCRGTVCIVQGRSEYIEKYFETIADLRRRGFAVAAYDHRGQGGSHRPLADPRKGHVQAFTEFDRDLMRFVDELVAREMPRPFIALAHSMGGNIVLRHAQSETSPFARLVLTSPMIRIHESLFGTSEAWARRYAETMCLFGMATAYVRGGNGVPEERLPFDGNKLTSDAVRYRRNASIIEQAPELSLGSPTIGWLRASLRSCRMLQRPDYAKYVAIPSLVFSAGNDRVVCAQSIEDFAVDLKLGGHIRLPESRHEILQENDAIRQRFWSAFDAYMDITPRTQAAS